MKGGNVHFYSVIFWHHGEVVWHNSSSYTGIHISLVRDPNLG